LPLAFTLISGGLIITEKNLRTDCQQIEPKNSGINGKNGKDGKNGINGTT
jgi:hypothetical protein